MDWYDWLGLSTVVELANWLIDQIVCALKRGFCWVIETLLEWVDPAIDAILTTLGPPPSMDFGFVGQVLGAARIWVPIDYLVLLLLAYMGWKAAFLSVYLIKRCIPTLG